MRHFTVSVFAILISLPALADARLPVVNVASAGVSARAAFGEPVLTPAAAPAESAPIVVEQTDAPKSRNVVARKNSKKSSADAGEQIVANADVLSPRRPSSDLWAKSDAPLRLPDLDEFSIIRADYDLPEEDLGTTSTIAQLDAPQYLDTERTSRRDIDLDAEIEKLAELQRRADASIRAMAETMERTASIRNTPARKTVARDVRVEKNDDIALQRMIVPMESDDVVVRAVEKSAPAPKIATATNDMSKMTPSELRKAFKKTYLSENKHLSTFQIDDRFDVASDMSSGVEGFTAKRDLSEDARVRPLEIKIRFRGDDAALSRENYNLLTEYASIVVSNPKRAIQVSIPESATRATDDRRLAARRLAIIEQVLRDTGVSEHRIMPVLSQRNEDGLVLRIISSDQYETLTQQKRDMFGDTVSKKTYKSMSW